MAKGISQELAEEILSLEPTAKLEFYLIYYDDKNENNFIAIHSSQNGINGKIYWQNLEYLPYNVESSGWEVKNDQTLPRPKLVISNINFSVSTLLKKFGNLNNAKVIRKITYARFLDDVNFPSGTNPFGEANPNAGAPDQKFYISRVVNENKERVEFELVSPLELENQKLPNRKIHSFRCPFIYRGHGCLYNGIPVSDSDNNVFLIKNTNTTFNADFIMTAENNFKDISNRERGSFATELTQLDLDQGLFTDGGSYPQISTTQKVFGQKSIYFDGSSAIVLCTRTVNVFSHEPNQTDRAVSFWFRIDGDETQEYIDLIDFGDLNGGFGVYLQKINGVYVLVGVVLDDSSKKFALNNAKAINKEQWYHACFSYTNYKNGISPYAYLFLDGQKISEVQISEKSARNSLVSTGINGIGGGFDTRVRDGSPQSNGFHSATAFKGYMDDIRFFLNPISPLLAENLFNNKLGGDTISQNESTNRGQYVEGAIYNRGDFVFIESKKYKMNSYGGKGEQAIRTYFISAEDNNDSSPLNDSYKWKKDSCGKSVSSCALRFGDAGYLPFGGFPGTHKYPFSQKQNGY